MRFNDHVHYGVYDSRMAARECKKQQTAAACKADQPETIRCPRVIGCLCVALAQNFHPLTEDTKHCDRLLYE